MKANMKTNKDIMRVEDIIQQEWGFHSKKPPMYKQEHELHAQIPLLTMSAMSDKNTYLNILCDSDLDQLINQHGQHQTNNS